METQTNLSIQDFRRVLRACNGKTVALDTETTGTKWWVDKVTTIGFHSPQMGVEGTIDIGIEFNTEKKKKKELEEMREEFLQSPELIEFDAEVNAIVREELKQGTKVVMHNAKFDMAMLDVDPAECYGWKPIDTTVLIHLYDSRMPKGMKDAEPILLGTNSKRNHVEEALSSPILRKRIWFWEPQVRQDYCLNDVRVTWQFAELLLPKIRKLDLEELFWKDMRYLKLIYYTEHLGIVLDQEFTVKAQQQLLLHTKELEQQLWDAVGYKFNWRSHKVLSKALYEDLGIEKPINPYLDEHGVDRSFTAQRGQSGQYNETMTSTFILMEKAHHPLGELVTALRESAKLKRVCDQWLELVDENSVIHSNFNITGTRTGRLSSSKPNLANVPSEVRTRFTQGLYSGGLKRSEEYNLRNAFIARPGHWMLSIDYKQQEMRLFAWVSQDPVLLDFVKKGKDIHLMVALKVWGDCGEQENKIHREWSKTIAFGLLYGMTTGALEHKLGMERSEAQHIINDYWTTFKRIRPTLKETIEECKTHNYLRYWSKRIWREEEEFFMYKGLNAKVQGGSADLLSIAALRTQDWLQKTGKGNIISYVYDELLMEVVKDGVEETANVIAEIMQIPDVLDLPFLTECKIGTTYGDIVKMKNENGHWLLPDKFKEKHDV